MIHLSKANFNLNNQHQKFILIFLFLNYLIFFLNILIFFERQNFFNFFLYTLPLNFYIFSFKNKQLLNKDKNIKNAIFTILF